MTNRKVRGPKRPQFGEVLIRQALKGLPKLRESLKNHVSVNRKKLGGCIGQSMYKTLSHITCFCKYQLILQIRIFHYCIALLQTLKYSGPRYFILWIVSVPFRALSIPYSFQTFDTLSNIIVASPSLIQLRHLPFVIYVLLTIGVVGINLS